MSKKSSETENFYDWMMAVDGESARAVQDFCICGFTATYKSRKDAKDYLKLKYMHSHWCSEYIDKDTFERLYGEQEKDRK